jgi:hypothetical protein
VTVYRLVIATIAVLTPINDVRAQPVREIPAATRAAARDMFRAFAEPFIGPWDCEIVEHDADGKVVWSDRQKREFRFSMHRHMMEERATLRTDQGVEYEGGLHLTTYDAGKGSIVQHGYWLPTQADPLSRLEGKVRGKGFDGSMRIRTNGGDDQRPLVIRWISADQWVLEVTDDGPRGTYLRERLTYTRRKPN